MKENRIIRMSQAAVDEQDIEEVIHEDIKSEIELDRDMDGIGEEPHYTP